MTRWEVLKENVSDERRLRDLSRLLRVIDHRFEGKVEMQKDIVGYMNDMFGWGNKRTMRNLGKLVDLNLLKCVRDQRKRWTKTYYLLDA